jgi:integrase
VYPAVSLKDARVRRDEAKALLAQGVDPGAHRQAAKAVAQAKKENTFEKVARQWHDIFKAGLAPKTAANKIARLERHIFPHIGKIPIDEITASDLRDVLQRIDNLGIATVSHTALNNISQILRFAIARELIPFDISAGLRGTLPPIRTTHHASITDPRQIGELLRAIDGFTGNTIIRLALKILAHVFVRNGELRKAEWDEINLDNAEWRIPAERMKMRSPHIVPLSRQVIESFTELREYTGFGNHVFPALQSLKMRDNYLSDVALLSALRRMGYAKDEMTVHGFRSMASTILNERGFNRDWIERQLAHSERNAVRASYNYAEYFPERRQMMQWFSDHLDALRDGANMKDNAFLVPATSGIDTRTITAN